MITTIRNGLVFEADMTNLVDTSGQGNTITNNGTTLTTDEKNRPTRARNFTTNDFLSIADNASIDIGTSDFSLIVRFKMPNVAPSSSTNYMFFDKRLSSSPYNGYALYYQTGGTTDSIRFQISDGTLKDEPVTKTIDDGEWHTLIISCDRNGDTNYYYDSELIGTKDFSARSGSLDNSQPLLIGKDTFGGSFLEADISGQFIIKTALSNEEVKIVTNEITNYKPLFKDCVAYYDFRGDAKDCVGQNDGTVSGATLTTDHLGNANQAYSFLNNDYISLPTKSSGVSGVEIMVKIDSLNSGGRNMIVASSDTSYNDVYFCVSINTSNNYLEFIKLTYSGGVQVGFSYYVEQNYVDSNWHHIVFSIDENNNPLCVVDGAEKTLTTSVSAVTNEFLSSTYDTYFLMATQRRDSGVDYFLDGDMSFYKEYSESISLDKAKELYNQSQRKYIYKFNEEAQ